MKLNKKGEFDYLLAMIIVVMSFVLLLIISNLIYNVFQAKSDIESCRISVLIQAETKMLPSISEGKKSPFEINCKKRYVTFYDTKVEQGTDPVKKSPIDIYYNGVQTKSFAKLNDYIVNEVVAEEMRMCYYQFGEGKLDVFNSEFNSVWGDNDVCFVCSEINFDKSTQLAGPNTYQGFMDYLNRTTFQRDSKVTYYQYFNQKGLSKVPWEIFYYGSEFDKNDFVSSNTYLVVFSKQDKRLVNTLNDMLTGCAKGLFSPAICTVVVSKNIADFILNKDLKNNYYTFVVPSDKIGNYCDIQAS